MNTATEATSACAGETDPRSTNWHLPAILVLALITFALRLPGFLALALGAATAYALPTAMRRSSRHGQIVLKTAVVMLGAGIDLGVMARIGAQGLGLAAGTLALTCLVGFLLTRALGIERDSGILITLGTAICGGSAIAAAAPVLKARGTSIATALGIVFALNAVALVLFPWLGAISGLSVERFGEWCALAIHDTSSVIGAAASRGERALEIATVTKLARSLWIVPVCLALALVTRDRQQPANRSPLTIPWFIGGFVALAALFTALPALEPLRAPLRDAGNRGLALALFLLGSSLDRDTLRSIRARHLGLGLALWLTLGATSYLVLSLRD